MFSPSELILIRHGVTETPDRLCGRTDVALSDVQSDILFALKKSLAPLKNVITSPARRCVDTATALWGSGKRTQDPRLWEQDFGAWENQLYVDLPDIGTLDKTAIARHTPPNGESYLDLFQRAKPALQEAAQSAHSDQAVAIVAHAGIIRAALGLALDDSTLGLGFEIAPLSVTRLRCLGGGQFSIISTNWHPA